MGIVSVFIKITTVYYFLFVVPVLLLVIEGYTLVPYTCTCLLLLFLRLYTRGPVLYTTLPGALL